MEQSSNPSRIISYLLRKYIERQSVPFSEYPPDHLITIDDGPRYAGCLRRTDERFQFSLGNDINEVTAPDPALDPLRAVNF